MKLPTFLLLLFSLSLAQECPSGAIPNSDSTKCFHLIPTKADFVVADQTCRLIGGNLASIGNSADNNLIQNMFFQWKLVDESLTRAWIGGNNLLTYGDWKWTDGELFDYVGFDSRKPKILGFNCLSIEAGPWMPTECFKKQPFVCSTKLQKPANCSGSHY
ncbi:hypothetical protein QR680_008335 [Steinernema hermaphroditum]|uniref:C-type lectin domain-containing protein n=1 Tax=Steinernema hermaphroditum TaxID=289476 RepID=A0AA39IG83_9BILA|nr:hypothetical protein QR680_008335 [Steinernema hermaphroditum]